MRPKFLPFMGVLTLAVFLPLAMVMSAPPKKAAKKAPAESARVINVTYFHGNMRCVSCKKIEAFTEEAVKSFFADDMKSKKVNYRVVNVEEKGNEHFVQDYQLYTKSVIVTDNAAGKEIRWKNLPKVWEFLHDKEAFKQYIRDEILSYQKADK